MLAHVVVRNGAAKGVHVHGVQNFFAPIFIKYLAHHAQAVLAFVITDRRPGGRPFDNGFELGERGGKQLAPRRERFMFLFDPGNKMRRRLGAKILRAAALDAAHEPALHQVFRDQIGRAAVDAGFAGDLDGRAAAELKRSQVNFCLFFGKSGAMQRLL